MTTARIALFSYSNRHFRPVSSLPNNATNSVKNPFATTLPVAYLRYSDPHVENHHNNNTEYAVMGCQITTDISGIRARTHTGWIVQRLYGKNHWCAAYVDDLCQADPEFLKHLSEQTPAYLHYICLTILAWLKSDREILPIAKQAKLLRTNNQKALLNSLYQPYPTGLLNALPKLGDKALTKNDYLRLVKLLRDPEKRRYLAHVSTIKPYHLQWIEDFPCDLLHWRILHSVKKSHHYASLKYLVKVIQNLDNHKHANVLISLKRLKTMSQLENWFRHHTQTLPFPEPPWDGNDWIIPIKSVKALKEAALKYKNCIYDYSRQILLGQYYFYEVVHGSVIVSLVRDPIIGWRIEQIEGIDHTTPNPTFAAKIKQAFVEAKFQVESMDDVDRLWDAGYSDW